MHRLTLNFYFHLGGLLPLSPPDGFQVVLSVIPLFQHSKADITKFKNQM